MKPQLFARAEDITQTVWRALCVPRDLRFVIVKRDDAVLHDVSLDVQEVVDRANLAVAPVNQSEVNRLIPLRLQQLVTSDIYTVTRFQIGSTFDQSFVSTKLTVSCLLLQLLTTLFFEKS